MKTFKKQKFSKPVFNKPISRIVIMTAAGCLVVMLSGRCTPPKLPGFAGATETASSVLAKPIDPAASYAPDLFCDTGLPETGTHFVERTAKAWRHFFDKTALILAEYRGSSDTSFEPSVLRYNLMALTPEDADEFSVPAEGFTVRNLKSSLETLYKQFARQYDLPYRTRAQDTCGGQIFESLSRKDAEWTSGLYRWIQADPRQAAARLGLPGSAVEGGYDPTNSKHVKEDPSTWLVPSWKNVTISIYNGDGAPAELYSNAQAIASLASVYTYYTGWEDVEGFKAYADCLWDASHSAHVSISGVYYCDGCIDPAAPSPENAIMAEEAALDATAGILSEESSESQEMASGASEEGKKAAGPGQIPNNLETAVGAEAQALPAKGTGNAAADMGNTAAGTGNAMTDTGNAASGTGNAESGTGDTSNAASAALSAGAQPSVAAVQPTVPQTQSPETEGVPMSDTQTANIGAVGGIEGEATQPSAGLPAALEAAEISASGPAGPADDIYRASQSASAQEPLGGAGLGQEADSNLPSPENPAVAMDPAAGSAAGLAGITADSIAAAPPVKSAEIQLNAEGKFCPGHVDLKITARINGISERNNLFTLAAAEGDKEKAPWPGWNAYTSSYARRLYAQDWMTAYGLSLTELALGKPLTSAQMSGYLNSLPAETSNERRAVIAYALNSVGKIPYYYGGKSKAPGYERNQFCGLTSPDRKGRILSGLDCSGWVNWVYWSVTGKAPTVYGTGGLARAGKPVTRENLQPGDIIVRLGADSHVMMFLGWTADGQMICVHETGGNTSNVTVSVTNVHWPYYRSLFAQ